MRTALVVLRDKRPWHNICKSASETRRGKFPNYIAKKLKGGTNYEII